jgi:hypothetical protein
VDIIDKKQDTTGPYNQPLKKYQKPNATLNNVSLVSQTIKQDQPSSAQHELMPLETPHVRHSLQHAMVRSSIHSLDKTRDNSPSKLAVPFMSIKGQKNTSQLL